MSQYAHLSVVDLEFAEASAHVPKSDPTDDIAEMRWRFDRMIKWGHENNKLLSTPASELRVEEHKVPVDGGEITVRCMIPTPTGGSAGPFPLLVNYHGGGYVVGGLSTDEPWLRQICVEQQVSVVDVDYRLGPEFPWPHSHEDSYAALKWVSENYILLHADLSKGFIISGTSAGGGITASLALRARDDPFFQERPLTGQLLQIPGTISPFNIPDKFKGELLSMDMPLDPRFLDKHSRLQFYELWKPDTSDINTWALLHPNHAGLAPAVFQICGADPLRDEGLLYEKLLKEAGVQTKLNVYPGVPHGFHVVSSQITLGKRYHQDRKDGLRWLLSDAV